VLNGLHPHAKFKVYFLIRRIDTTIWGADMESQHSGRRVPNGVVHGQVRLLTLLVALHLVVFSESRTWLSPAQSVGVMRRWHVADSTVLDVLQRVRISSRALPIAVRLAECHGCLLDPVRMRAVFDSRGSIDADAVLYRIIRRACEAALLRD
jgi:hypothetical protein